MKKLFFIRNLKNLIYIVYCFALFQLVTTTDFESFSNNFIPFKEIMRYKTTSVLFYRNVIGNIAIFLPFGFIITDMIREKAKKCNILITAIITLLTSLTIETIQMFIGRSFDVDDIILNFLGGILGFIFYIITHKVYSYVPDKYKTNSSKLLATFLMIIIFIGLFLIMYEVTR